VQISRDVKNYSLLRIFSYAGDMGAVVHVIGDGAKEGENSQILHRYKAYADR